MQITWLDTAQHKHSQSCQLQGRCIVWPGLVSEEIFLGDVIVVVCWLEELHHEVEVSHPSDVKLWGFFTVDNTRSTSSTIWPVGAKPSLGSREQRPGLSVCNNLGGELQLFLHVGNERLDGKLSDEYSDSVDVVPSQQCGHILWRGL